MRYMSLILVIVTLLLSSCSALRHRVDAEISSNEIESSQDFNNSQVKLLKISPELFSKYPELLTPLTKEVASELIESNNLDYKLGAFDVVIVAVWEYPELSQPLGSYRTDEATGQKIAEDGTMFYPYVGRVQAAGLTVVELSKILTEKLSEKLRNPQVDVKVTAYRSKKVFIGGEVNVPGTHYFSDLPMSLPEAINRAKGLKATADGSLVYLTRGDKVYQIDFMSMYRQGIALEKVMLQDGDKVYVSSLSENKVFVMGEVINTESVSLIHGQLSLTEALTEAGGMNKMSADAEYIYVFRMNANNEISVFHLDADNPVAMIIGDQFKLQARDIVYVDTHKLAQWNRVASLIFPTLQLLNSAVNTGLSVSDRF